MGFLRVKADGEHDWTEYAILNMIKLHLAEPDSERIFIHYK